MTRKHYKQIAAAFKAETDLGLSEAEMQLLLVLAQRIANICAADNPRFDRDRFLAACGVR